MAEIVRLTPDDWQQLRDLRIRATKEVPLAFGRTTKEEAEKTEEEWREQLKDSYYYGAKEEGALIGMLRVAHEKDEMRAHIAQIYGVYVAPEARGKKIGRSLMDIALKELTQNQHILKVRLSVAETQKEALNLYSAYGFKQVGIFQKEGKFDGRYIDIIQMEKFLH